MGSSLTVFKLFTPATTLSSIIADIFLSRNLQVYNKLEMFYYLSNKYKIIFTNTHNAKLCGLLRYFGAVKTVIAGLRGYA